MLLNTKALEKPTRQDKGNTRKNVPSSTQSDNSECGTSLINLGIDFGREIDTAHNAVAQLLVEYCLVRIAVILHDFVEAVHERVGRRHGSCSTTIREAHHLAGENLSGYT